MGAATSVRIKQLTPVWFLVILLLIPYLLLFLALPTGLRFDSDEIFWAAQNTLFQAFWSSILAFFLGLVMALGIFQLESVRSLKSKNFLLTGMEWLMLLPSFLPPLYALVVFLTLIDPFPMGFPGLIMVHGAIYAGLLAVKLRQLLAAEIGSLALVTWQMGASKWQFWKVSAAALRRGVAHLVLPVFVACWASFSIPLAIGGGRATTLEILIYEKLRLSSDWSEALAIALVQALLLGTGSVLWLSWQKNTDSRTLMPTGLVSPLIRSKLGLILAVLYILFFVGGFVFGCMEGITAVVAMEGLWQVAWESLQLSVVVSMISGLLISVLLLLCLQPQSTLAFRRFLIFYSPPSTALLGLALLFLPTSASWMTLGKYVLALVISFFVVVYKLGFSRLAEGLDLQVKVAQQMGASTWLIFSSILWPQAFSLAMKLGGVAAIWSLGDFALAKMVLPGEWTLAVVIEGLLSSYRVSAASGLMLLLFLLSLVVYGFFTVLASSRTGKRLLCRDY